MFQRQSPVWLDEVTEGRGVRREWKFCVGQEASQPRNRTSATSPTGSGSSLPSVGVQIAVLLWSATQCHSLKHGAYVLWYSKATALPTLMYYSMCLPRCCWQSLGAESGLPGELAKPIVGCLLPHCNTYAPKPYRTLRTWKATEVLGNTRVSTIPSCMIRLELIMTLSFLPLHIQNKNLLPEYHRFERSCPCSSHLT